MAKQNDLAEPVYWRGTQWAVTAYGLETIGDPYHYYLEKERLGSLNNRGDCFALLLHLLEKNWLDICDWREAWRQAMISHATHFPNVPDEWQSRFEQAVDSCLLEREVHRRSRKYLRPDLGYSPAELRTAHAKAREEMEREGAKDGERDD